MKYPRISIVTPSFNQGKFIEKTIQSVLGQQYPNLEFVIIDGGSTDETLSIIRKYEKLLTYWVSEPDRGQSHAINKGLTHCTGDVFNWINSDDFLEPGALFYIAEEYTRSPFSALCGRVNVWDTDVFSHVRKQSYVGPTAEDSIAEFNINQEGTWWGLKKIKELGGVNEQLHYCMDLDLWFRVLMNSEIRDIRTIETILSNFRRHFAAKSTAEGKKGNQSPFLAEQAILFEAMKPLGERRSFFNLLPPDNKTDKLSIPEYLLNQKQRRKIFNKRIFFMLKEAVSREEWKKAKILSEMLGFPVFDVRFRDLLYLKRLVWKFPEGK